VKLPEGGKLGCEVTFHVRLKDVDDVALQVKAAEIDEHNGNAPEDYPLGYTFAQAFQIIWHEDPEWVHRHMLCGWVLDRTDESGDMRPVWGTRDDGVTPVVTTTSKES
jgi:hypothetical protein